MLLIEYENKSALNENPDVATINKCTASDLNQIKAIVNNNSSEFHDDIEDLKSRTTSIENVCKYYLNQEIDSGQVWINGKPIYRKVITGATGSTAGDLNVYHNIENLDMFIRVEGFTIESDQRFFPNFYRDFDSQYALIVYYANPSFVKMSYGSSRTNKNFYLILEYTKTTD